MDDAISKKIVQPTLENFVQIVDPNAPKLKEGGPCTCERGSLKKILDRNNPDKRTKLYLLSCSRVSCGKTFPVPEVTENESASERSKGSTSKSKGKNSPSPKGKNTPSPKGKGKATTQTTLDNSMQVEEANTSKSKEGKGKAAGGKKRKLEEKVEESNTAVKKKKVDNESKSKKESGSKSEKTPKKKETKKQEEKKKSKEDKSKKSKDSKKKKGNKRHDNENDIDRRKRIMREIGLFPPEGTIFQFQNIQFIDNTV